MNALEFLKSLHKLDEVFIQHDDAEYNERQLIQFAERYHNYKLKLLNSKTMDYSKIKNIELDGIDMSDAPDFSDAFIVSADYDGKPMTDEQLEELNDDTEFIHKCVIERI